MRDNKSLRREMRKKRACMSVEEVMTSSMIISDKLYEEIEEFKPKNILCYYPMGNEVNLLSLYKKLLVEGYNLFFPVTYIDMIRFYNVDNLDDFTKGAFNIHEPDDRSREFREEEAFVIAPGLAFDLHNNRVGYGRAYYDRFLRYHTKAYPVGVCYRFQVVDEVYATELDVPVKKVITE